MNKPYIHGMLPDVSGPTAGVPTFEPSQMNPAPAKRPSGEIRFTGDMQRVQAQPTDVFVLHCDQELEDATAQRLGAMATSALNGAKVIVLGKGMKLEFVPQPAPTTKVVVNNTVGDVATPDAIAAAIKQLQGGRSRGGLAKPIL